MVVGFAGFSPEGAGSVAKIVGFLKQFDLFQFGSNCFQLTGSPSKLQGGGREASEGGR